MMKETVASLSINKCSDGLFYLRVEDAVSGIPIVEVVISPKDLADALGGLAGVAGLAKVPSLSDWRVGASLETKTVQVDISDMPNIRWDDEHHLFQKHIERELTFELDRGGWEIIGLDERPNHHRISKDGKYYSVNLHRYVVDEEERKKRVDIVNNYLKRNVEINHDLFELRSAALYKK